MASSQTKARVVEAEQRLAREENNRSRILAVLKEGERYSHLQRRKRSGYLRNSTNEDLIRRARTDLIECDKTIAHWQEQLAYWRSVAEQEDCRWRWHDWRSHNQGESRTEDEVNAEPQQPSGPSAASRGLSIQTWHTICKEALSDLPTLSTFPAPPAWPCSNFACRQVRRSLAACSCNIREAFQYLEGYPRSLKTERLKWHPDKFARGKEGKVVEWQAMAKEVFVVANDMYEKASGKNSGR